MYSRKAWGGSVDPFILTKFVQEPQSGDSDPLVSLVIFEWSDENLIGRPVPGDSGVRPPFPDHDYIWIVQLIYAALGKGNYL